MSADKPVRLVPLLCIRCQFPIPAQPDEVAWVCEQCGQGLLIDDENGAEAQEIFFSNSIQQGKKGSPYWVASGQVTFSRRDTYKGNESRDSQQFWASPRLFFIPAWNASLEEVITTGVFMLNSPAQMQAGSPCPFAPVVTLPDDMKALAEFMILSIEAGRRDSLKRVEFEVKLQPPQLWILP